MLKVIKQEIDFSILGERLSQVWKALREYTRLPLEECKLIAREIRRLQRRLVKLLHIRNLERFVVKERREFL